MSASREKKNRQNKPVEAPVEAPKKGMSKAAKKALTIVAAVVLVAVIVFFGMISGGFFQKNMTAAVANGHKLTPAMMNYYYVASYQELQQYLGSIMDGETPLSEQEFSGEEFDTWADYIIDYAAAAAARAYAIYDEAVANGYTLSESGKSSINNELEMVKLYASMNGFQSPSAMLAYQYGTGCNMKSYEEYLHVQTLINEYSSSIQSEMTYTDDEIHDYYEENSDAFDSATYRCFSITPSMLGEEKGEAGQKACELAAQAMAEASRGDELAFMNEALSLVPADQAETYDPDTNTYYENYTYANCPDSIRDWIADESRQNGDTTYIANGENGYQVVYFIRHEDLSYQMPNVRHILIGFTNSTDEANVAETEAEAQRVLDEYLAGEQTEEAFAELAKTYSDDNAEEGGLYENVAPGTMVEAFDGWIYDSSRQTGDTGLVETEYGFHVMYFAGYGRSYLDYTVENTMRSSDFSDWTSEITADATHTVNEAAKRFIIKL